MKLELSAALIGGLDGGVGPDLLNVCGQLWCQRHVGYVGF